MNILKNSKQFVSIRYYAIIPHTPRFDLHYRSYYPGTVGGIKMGGIKINRENWSNKIGVRGVKQKDFGSNDTVKYY